MIINKKPDKMFINILSYVYFVEISPIFVIGSFVKTVMNRSIKIKIPYSIARKLDVL